MIVAEQPAMDRQRFAQQPFGFFIFAFVVKQPAEIIQALGNLAMICAEELAAHGITIDEAVEVIWNKFDVRRNKKRHGGYQLIGYTDAGRPINLIVYGKSRAIIRVVTGW